MRARMNVTALVLVGGIGAGLLWGVSSHSSAQLQLPSRTTRNDDAVNVVIEREPAVLIEPKTYQVPLALEPIKQLALSAVTDGVVRELRCKTGDQLVAEAAALQMENKEQQLLVEQAKANFRAATVEVRRAKTGKDADLIEIAEAKLEAAEAAVELAELRVAQTTVRSPFDGQVFRIRVLPGEWVRAGQPLVELADTAKLQVEIPVDRDDENSAEGKTATLRIGDAEVEGTIQTILPPAERFHPLRDIVDSVASAIVVLDNPEGQYAVGQTVHSTLIPRHPVCEVAKASMKSQEDGTWKLQVIRGGIVKDLPVSPLGRLGEDRMYVSGPFAAGDEVIFKTSQELPDGTQIVQDPRAQIGRPGTRVKLDRDRPR